MIVLKVMRYENNNKTVRPGMNFSSKDPPKPSQISALSLGFFWVLVSFRKKKIGISNAIWDHRTNWK